MRSSDLRRIDFHWLTSHVVPCLSLSRFCCVCGCACVRAHVHHVFSWAGKITRKRQPVVSWRKDWRRHGSQTWWFPRFHKLQRVFLLATLALPGEKLSRLITQSAVSGCVSVQFPVCKVLRAVHFFSSK